MVAKKKKIKKTVERVKNDKSVKADIIATNKEDANQNINKQTVQIVFPPDTEIRKVKKKKKRKPTNTERNKLLDQLKSILEEYDTTQAEVRKKNITIPAELGLPMIKTSELKTNDDIKRFIDDVSAKLAKLRELLEKPQGLQVSPFGNNPLLTRPGYRQPTIAIPQTLPSPPIQTIIPSGTGIPKIVIPSGTKPPSDDGDATQRALQQIAEETKRELERQGKTVPPEPGTTTPGSSIVTPTGTTPGSSTTPRDEFEPIKKEVLTLSQLSPTERIKKIQDLENEINDIQSARLKTQRELDPDFVRTRNALIVRLDQVAEQTREQIKKGTDPFPNKDVPTPTQTPTQTPRERAEEQQKILNLTTDTINVNGKPVKVSAPAGFMDIYDKYRKFIKDILFDTTQRIPGYYHIPISKLNNLERERDNFEVEYSEYMTSLNEQQLAYIGANFGNIDNEMRKGSIDDIKETLRINLQKKGQNIKEITVGNERSQVESKAKEALDKGQKLKDDFQQSEVERMRKVIDDADTTYKTVNMQLQTASDNSQVLSKKILNKMLKEVRTQRDLVSNTYDKIPDNAQILVQGSKEEIEFKLQQIGGKLQQILADPKNIKQFMTEETGETPRLSSTRQEDIAIIVSYINGERKTFADRVQAASLNLFGMSFTNDLFKRSRDDKRTILGRALDDLGAKSPRQFEKEYEKQKQKPFDPNSLIDRDTREKFEADKKKKAEEAEKERKRKEAEEGHSWQFAPP